MPVEITKSELSGTQTISRDETVDTRQPQVGRSTAQAYNSAMAPRPEQTMQKRSINRFIILASGLIVAGCIAAGLMFAIGGEDARPAERPSNLTLQEIPFNGERAFGYLEQLCAIGRRYSGSPGMQKQQQLLISHFEKLGAEVEQQTWRIRHPIDGSPVQLTNLIVRWHPERKERVLLAAHYDTRPYPDRDQKQPRGVFVGANDGASGVAVLMELGNMMPKLQTTLGVDFVFFDAEEFVFNEEDRYFLGSEYFSRDYRAAPRDFEYRWAVLLDMIGDADLQIFFERNTMAWRDSRPMVEEIWSTAQRLGVTEFIPRAKHRIRDDHLPLHNTAGIPSCDIIDFDYPYWHTTADTPDKCSPLSLAKVGWVLSEWLSTTR